MFNNSNKAETKLVMQVGRRIGAEFEDPEELQHPDDDSELQQHSDDVVDPEPHSPDPEVQQHPDSLSTEEAFETLGSGEGGCVVVGC